MRIVPSQVVAFIDKAFPQFQGADHTRFSVPLKRRREVASLLALLDSLGAEHLASLDPDQQYQWTIAVTAIRDALEQWPSTPGYNLSRAPELGNEQPILVVRGIAALCPDDAPTASPTTLAFLVDPAMQETLALDISTARSALANGEFKAASVMAGSVCEAVLLWAISRRSEPEIVAAADACRGRKEKVGGSSPERWGLAELAAVAFALSLITEATRKALDGARGFRNLIHPGREQRTGLRPTLGTATLAVGAMTLLVEDLEARP